MGCVSGREDVVFLFRGAGSPCRIAAMSGTTWLHGGDEHGGLAALPTCLGSVVRVLVPRRRVALQYGGHKLTSSTTWLHDFHEHGGLALVARKKKTCREGDGPVIGLNVFQITSGGSARNYL